MRMCVCAACMCVFVHMCVCAYVCLSVCLCLCDPDFGITFIEEILGQKTFKVITH